MLYFRSIETLRHTRLDELLHELAPELDARGFTKRPGLPAWARDHPRGLLTIALSYAPDDEEGGWIEPFVGLIDQTVETQLAAHAKLTNSSGPRHTLLIGSTRWFEPTLDRQPAHSRSEALEVANAVLRWWTRALPVFVTGYGESRRQLDTLFNTDHPQAGQYLQHELYRSLRGLAIRKQTNPGRLTEALGFHRERMQPTGYWDIYGEQIRAFAMAIG